MAIAFGVRLNDLPSLRFQLPVIGPPIAEASWSHAAGPVVGEPFWLHTVGGRILTGWAGYAAYDIDYSRSPCLVRVTLETDATEAATAFVLSVLPLILPVWGLEPLHGSAVLTQAGALVVLGPSGAGKSSVAAALVSRGFPFLSDDACPFDAELRLWPGPVAMNPRWADALQAPIAEYNAKKIREPELHSGLPTTPAALVVLAPERGVELGVTELPAIDRFRTILANTRHSTFLGERRQALQFRVATILARSPMAYVRLDPSRHGPDEILDLLASWRERVGVATPGFPPKAAQVSTDQGNT